MDKLKLATDSQIHDSSSNAQHLYGSWLETIRTFQINYAHLAKYTMQWLQLNRETASMYQLEANQAIDLLGIMHHELMKFIADPTQPADERLLLDYLAWLNELNQRATQLSNLMNASIHN